MSVPAEEAQATRIPKRWPLLSRLQARSNSVPILQDARLVNAYAEYDAEDKDYWVYKRPGMGTVFASGAGTPQGAYFSQSSQFLCYAFGGSLVVGGGGGSIAETIQIASFDTLQGATPLVFEWILTMTPAGGLYWTKTNALVTTAQATPNSAPLARGIATLDGTVYLMDILGNIWGSNINDPTTWNALNVIQANSSADAGVAIAKQLNYIIAMKQYSTQIFYDAGNATGSPLSPVPDAQIPLGCLFSGSVREIDNTLLWVTANENIQPQVVQLDNLVPKIVSTPAVERVLQYAQSILRYVFPVVAAEVTACTLKLGGHRFYILNIPAFNLGVTGKPQGLTLVYDIDQQLWYPWTDINGNWWQGVSISSNQIGGGSHLVQTVNGTSFALHFLDMHNIYGSDNGSVFPVDIYTPNMDFGTVRRKTLNALYFNGDRVPANLKVRYSDDDFKTWSNFRTVDLNAVKPRLSNCGTFQRRRAYHLRHQTNGPFRMRSMDMQMDIGNL